MPSYQELAIACGVGQRRPAGPAQVTLMLTLGFPAQAPGLAMVLLTLYEPSKKKSQTL